MSGSPPKRVIAIVGRPNVGKSAIFNRIARKRVAIVHDEPGVTRDRVACTATWNSERFELIDTGGLGFLDRKSTKDVIAAETGRQVDVAIEDAAAIIFVVDITEGVVPLDKEVARKLHASGRPIFLAANKADTERLDRAAEEFEIFGYPVYPVAALHDRGFDALLTDMVKKLPAYVAQDEARNPLRVAIVGRPNAGKSSYINRLLNNERVIVSPVPGTTRDSIEIPFSVGKGALARHYLLIDTAGMRQRRKVDNPIDTYSLMRADESIERADVVVLVMDATEGPTQQDKKIAAKILEAHKGCLLMISKWDLAEGVTQRAYEKAFRETVPFLDFAPVMFSSSQSGFNIRRTIEMLDHVGAQITAQLPTAMLNRVLHDATKRVQPPLVQGKRMKIYYATQTGTRPIRLRLFVNDPARSTASYRSFLVNQLRTAVGLEGAPVVLEFRSSHADR
jgi:GTP-binding protein